MEKTIKLPKKTQYLWQIRFSVVLLSAAILSICFVGVSLWMILPAAIIILLWAIFVFLYLPRYFASFRIVCDKKAIIVNKGVIFKMTYIMPYPRMVYTTLYSLPISYKMGLSGVIIKAARGWLILPEMEKEKSARFILITMGEKNENNI